MAILFTGAASGVENRGRVQVLDRPGTGLSPGSIVQVPGWGGFFGFKAIFTNIEIAEQGNYQFLHTLGNHIYVYVFGDRIGTFGLSGLAFYDNCVGAAPFGRIGIINVINYYRQQRLAVNPSPVLITINPDAVFRCFLVGMRGRVMNPNLRMFQFQLSFALIPDEQEIGGDGGEENAGNPPPPGGEQPAPDAPAPGGGPVLT